MIQSIMNLYLDSRYSVETRPGPARQTHLIILSLTRHISACDPRPDISPHDVHTDSQSEARGDSDEPIRGQGPRWPLRMLTDASPRFHVRSSEQFREKLIKGELKWLNVYLRGSFISEMMILMQFYIQADALGNREEFWVDSFLLMFMQEEKERTNLLNWRK